MRIHYENLTPFGLWLARKWPLVWRSDYQKRQREIANLERTASNLISEIAEIAEIEVRRFVPPEVAFSEKYDPIFDYTTLTIRMEPLNVIVDSSKSFKYGPEIKKKIINELTQKFSRELAGRYIDVITKRS